MLEANEKVWLFHRGTWTKITNPLDGRETPDTYYRRQSLKEYTHKWWEWGPTFLYPNYSGLLVYTYTYSGTRNLPKYLIWINGIGQNRTIYAQDLPDLLEVLALLAPLVLTGIFVDIYRQSRKKE